MDPSEGNELNVGENQPAEAPASGDPNVGAQVMDEPPADEEDPSKGGLSEEV